MADESTFVMDTLNDFSQKIEDVSLGTRLCIVGNHLQSDQQLIDCAKSLNYVLAFSETGYEYIKEDITFVLDDFESNPLYEQLFRNQCHLLGSVLIKQCARKHELPPVTVRPLHCLAMRQLILCFTGFRKKEELSQLVTLVHHMGGSIRKDFSSKVTHLIANATGGEKYRAAVSLGTAIMTKEWILRTWELRHQIETNACHEIFFTKYKVQPFFCCKLSFLGYSAEEQTHMEDVTNNNGGQVVSIENFECTHVVVEDQFKDVSNDFFDRCHVVKGEWFWASIQMDACADEGLYMFTHDPKTPRLSKPSPSTSESKSAKRRRLRESLAHLASSGDLSLNLKRKSNDYSRGSLSGSFLDATPDFLPDGQENITPATHTSDKCSHITSRQQVCMELLQTESNYVGILRTIMTLFREPLEKANQVGGPLLDPTEIKIIFGNLTPIYELHQMIQSDLAALMSNWKEDARLANIILRHADAILKSYPPFVNFFEKMKEMLIKCDNQKPRFHAFLKICQSKTECGRQSLVELLIRPVQRLPSVILLLKDILKHTNKTNPDYPDLEQAIRHLKKVMTDINEDKRKTEGHVAMFDIVNDIDNCPPNLLSSHRSFITKADMVELSDGVCGRGDPVSMFLFSDSLEICKRRIKAIHALKSPGSGKALQKCYKHVSLIPLSHIKRVVDIKETSECKNVFALICRSNTELKERLYTFRLLEDIYKMDFVKTICRHIANTVCRADSENFLACLEPQELDIETSDVVLNTFSKALRFASKTSRKVSKAFSFSKSPRKLKRAMSSISSYHDFDQDDLQGSRLAACYSPEEMSPIGSIPSTPVTARQKIKSSSPGLTASNYL